MATFIRLVNYNSSEDKEREFFNQENRFFMESQSDFLKIPGNPITYRTNGKILNIFENNKKLGDVADFKTGITTGDNILFMKEWFEVDFRRIYFFSNDVQDSINIKAKWFPCCSGGLFRNLNSAEIGDSIIIFSFMCPLACVNIIKYFNTYSLCAEYVVCG